MNDIYQSKEKSIGDTPLLLLDCSIGDLPIEHWSTHGVIVNGIAYKARVLKQNVFEMQFGSDLGVDAIPKISVELANADSYFSQIERSRGVKGSQLTVSLVFYSFPSGAPSSDVKVLFKGTLNAPELITEETFRVSAINRLTLQRVVLPDIRVQKRCPWNFPGNLAERQEAVTGGAAGRYSRYYRCGYSPDIAGGVGNLSPDGTPFTTCSYTRSDCVKRGMFSSDALGNLTARFGGIEFVPASTLVRSAGERGSHLAAVEDNEARYNDFVPLLYGTAWYSPSVVFARNDGNLTHFEVLLGAGEIRGVQKVLVNSIEIPIGQNGRNMTGTGWYNVVSYGQRNGSFNLDFTDKNGNALGDPYGSMAFLSVVVPNRVNDGSSLPSIQVLADGLIISQYTTTGDDQGQSFSNNPAWIILDLLRRIGWSTVELDLTSFAAAASYCAEAIQTADLFGNSVMTPRFQCNLVVKQRRTAADVIRGIRNANRLLLRYGSNGLLQLTVENSISLQQPAQIPSSNAQSSLGGGWPAYEFGDGTNGTTGIARTSSGASSVRMLAKSTADSPNRFVAEFQDAFNEYQQDSLSIVDANDVSKTGQEVTSTAPVLGFPHFDQAARVLKFYLDKSVSGNTLVEFQTSIKAFGLSPGDIIALTYIKEGLERQPFRVLKIVPGPNYRTAAITAQWHDDEWYLDTNGQTSADAARRQAGFSVGLPRPLAGIVPNDSGDLDFGVVESVTQTPDGTATVTASVSFASPTPVSTSAPDVPLVSLSATINQGAGTLAGGQDLYYAISSLGEGGSESGLSFIVHARLPPGSFGNTVTLSSLSFPSGALGFTVYRGPNPSSLFQIANSQNIASQFLDAGLAATAILPPDPNYDHADFYWRLELQPPTTATNYNFLSIGSSILEMIPGNYVGMTVRIISGTGSGQERAIAGNTSSTVAVTSPWDIPPDFTSSFVVSQSTYQFGAMSRTSPIQFTIPNQAGNVIHLSGRSANCNGIEAPYELSPITRWTIGGAGILNVDSAPPSTPSFGLSVPDNIGGTVLFGAIAFPDLSNLTTVTAGTYTLYYLDEINCFPLAALSGAVSESDLNISVTPALGSTAPPLFLVDAEVLGIEQVNENGIAVTRGMHGTVAASHGAGASIFPVQQNVFIVPFPKSFFGSPASGDWSYPVSIPNVRIISAELTVTNSQGTSPTSVLNFTGLQDGGLRTLSGGQFSFQIGGFLAVQTGAAPDIIVDAPKAVRDVYAIVKQAPSGAAINIGIQLNGNPYCSLTIPDGATTVSASIDGASLPPLRYQDRLSLDINSVGLLTPGSGLTVIIRV